MVLRRIVSLLPSQSTLRITRSVRLLPCQPPNGSLEPAPRTSLRKDTRDERWDGFWCIADERYYARCTSAHGVEQWYRVFDEPRSVERARDSRPVRVLSLPVRRDVGRDSRVVQRDVSRTMLLFAPSGRRPILVGTRPPRASAKPRNQDQGSGIRSRVQGPRPGRDSSEGRR
jgi:hypothetical protein